MSSPFDSTSFGRHENSEVFAAHLACRNKNWVHINLNGIALNTDIGYNKFMELAMKPKIKYDVIIIDPLYTPVKGSFHSAATASPWIVHIRNIRTVFACASLVCLITSISNYLRGIIFNSIKF